MREVHPHALCESVNMKNEDTVPIPAGLTFMALSYEPVPTTHPQDESRQANVTSDDAVRCLALGARACDSGGAP